jgi:hypothetical protein
VFKLQRAFHDTILAGNPGIKGDIGPLGPSGPPGERGGKGKRGKRVSCELVAFFTVNWRIFGAQLVFYVASVFTVWLRNV